MGSITIHQSSPQLRARGQRPAEASELRDGVDQREASASSKAPELLDMPEEVLRTVARHLNPVQRATSLAPVSGGMRRIANTAAMYDVPREMRLVGVHDDRAARAWVGRFCTFPSDFKSAYLARAKRDEALPDIFDTRLESKRTFFHADDPLVTAGILAAIGGITGILGGCVVGLAAIETRRMQGYRCTYWPQRDVGVPACEPRDDLNFYILRGKFVGAVLAPIAMMLAMGVALRRSRSQAVKNALLCEATLDSP
jgi:hypothetical protein